MTDLIAKAELLGERYRPHILLGRGESAQAYLAKDTWTPSREVVLKIQLVSTPVSATHLRKEYGLLAGLSHPHLLEVYEVFEIPAPDDSSQPRICLVESTAAGKPLQQWQLTDDKSNGQAHQAEYLEVDPEISALCSPDRFV